MRFSIIVLLAVIIVSGCKDKKQVTEMDDSHAIQHKYIPTYYHNLFLGMPREQFEEGKTNVKPVLQKLFEFSAYDNLGLKRCPCNHFVE